MGYCVLICGVSGLTNVGSVGVSVGVNVTILMFCP